MTVIPRAVLVLMLCGFSPVCLGDEIQQAAERLLQQSGVTGGLLVHLGCGDGRLTAALSVDNSFVVQGLDTDARKIEPARSYLRSRGVYGRVTVDDWDGKHLPYADNLVNLIVVESPAPIAQEELLRVLAPLGVAMIRQDGQWTKLVKPWPAEIGPWTHYLQGPDNNAVAADSVVGPPQFMQWVCGPRYARSHEINSSMAAMVSGEGRLFYIWDDGPTGVTDPRLPPDWSLIARNAFNGLLLWKRPMPDWGWRQWHDGSRWDDPRERARMLRHLPPTLPRRLVAANDRIYVTLGYQAPVSVLDAATGELVAEFAGTASADEILLAGDTLLLRLRTPDSPPEPDVWGVMPQPQSGRVLAVDAQDGRKRWQSEPERMAPLTLATAGGRVFYSTYQQVVCLDIASGRENWRSEPVDGATGQRASGGTLVAGDDVVLYTPIERGVQGQLHAYAADTGELRWRGPKYVGPGISNPPDLFVVDGSVWLGETNFPHHQVKMTAVTRQGFDPKDGRVVREVSVPKLKSPGHHYRCYRSKATERYLLLPKRGVEFLDLLGDDHMRHDWLRAPCIYGVMPANGMLYVAPHQCVCYPGVLLSNFNAMTARVAPDAGPPEPATRLHRGAVSIPPQAGVAVSSDDWPTYRRDARRSGGSATELPEALQVRWSVSLGGRMTPPVVADGRLFVAHSDAHTIHALDAASGDVLWSYTGGGRIDSPPTVHGPLVLFGAADGWVYCLQAASGELVWRFMAAPRERRIAAFGQVESAWPVHGSVLVQRDTSADPPRDIVYFATGRSTFLDGGMLVYGLDPFSGQVIHRAQWSGPRPNPFEDTGMAGYMDGAKTDILTSDGADLYLFQERMRSDLARVEAPLQNLGNEGGGFRIYPAAPERGSTGKRLLTTSGFLDDSYNEGTFWAYTDRWPGWDRKMGRVPVYGQLLVFDDSTLYGLHVFTDDIRVRRGFTLGDEGYRLFARQHDAGRDTWSIRVPVRVRAMVLADGRLFFAGPPDQVDDDDPLAALEGRKGSVLWSVSAADGEPPSEIARLDALPVFDGLIAAAGRLYLSTTDGQLHAVGGRVNEPASRP